MDSRVVQIFVSKISTTKLRNVEMMYGDKNDVFLVMKFGDKWSARTATVWEGGSDVSWSYSESVDTNMKWTATVSEIMAGSLDISAMDDNKMTSSKLIGVGQQQIVVPSALLQNASVGASVSASGGVSTVVNMEVIVEVPLFEKIGGKAAGTVSVTLLIKSAATPAAVTAAVAAAVPVAAVTTTAATTAAAVAPAAVAPAAAPLVAPAAGVIPLRASSATISAANEISNAQTIPTTNAPGVTTAASSSSASSAVTTVPVVTAATHINSSTNIDVNKSSTAAAAVANAVTASQKIEGPFFTGILHLKSIRCHGLKNVEIMGKNDPYVTLNFGSQIFSTSVLENAGEDAIFEYLDFKFNVCEESLKFESMILNVFDKNCLRNDVLIGKNSISLRNVLCHINVNTDISIDILDEKGKVSGKVILFLKLIPHVINNKIIEENIGIEVQVPLNYETVVLRIIRIKISDLNTVITDKVKKPYTKITVGGVHFETVPVSVHSTGSTYTVFDHLDFSLEVTKQMLEGEMQNKNYDNDVGVSCDIVSSSQIKSESKTDKDMEKEEETEKEKQITKDNKKKNDDEKKNENNSRLLNIEMFNSVLGFDSMIGSGSVSVKSACLQNYESLLQNGKQQKPSNEELEILTNLVTKKGEYVGKVVLYVTRQLLSNIMILEKSKLFLSPEHSLKSLEDIKFKESYPAGVILKIESVTVHNLKNTEIIGKQA